MQRTILCGAALSAVIGGVGCAGGGDEPPAFGVATSALVSNASVLGFETTSGWQLSTGACTTRSSV